MGLRRGHRRIKGGDCESTFHMRIKCGRSHLTIFFLALLVLSVSVSSVLHAKHQKTVLSQKKMNSAASRETTSALSRHALFDKMRKMSNRSPPVKMPKSKVAKKKGAVDHRTGEVLQANDKKVAETNPRKGSVDRREKGNVAQAKENIMPLASSLSPNATFAACLLIKDDNDILPEWLAYHYHVIGLRDLVVAVDPLSVQFPTEILERWRSLTDMRIQEWTDDDYMPSDFLVYQKPPDKYVENNTDFISKGFSAEDILEISTHRYRQRVFLAKCMSNFREQGNSWVMHIDTDEYITPSKLLRQMKPDYLRIPPMDEPGAVLDLLKQTVEKTPQQVSYPCVSMLRVLFGSVESPKEDMWKDVPPEFNAAHFESLRWRYHALPHNMSFHGNPKVILDVSAIPKKNFPEEIVFSIHRPVQAYCHRNNEVAFTHFRKQPIAVNHYLGSWERYAGRNDKRRSRAVYEAKANVRRGKDDGNRLWLKGFLKSVGFDLTRKLLGDFYMVEHLRTVNQTLPTEK